MRGATHEETEVKHPKMYEFFLLLLQLLLLLLLLLVLLLYAFPTRAR